MFVKVLFNITSSYDFKSFSVKWLRNNTPCLISADQTDQRSDLQRQDKVLSSQFWVTNNKYQRLEAGHWRLESSHPRTADTAGGQQQDDDGAPRPEGGAAALRRRGGQPRARAPRGAARPPGTRRQAGAALQVGPEVRVAGAHCGGAGEVRGYLGDDPAPSCTDTCAILSGTISSCLFFDHYKLQAI